MIGLVVARYVIRVPALPTRRREELVERIGPVLRHHLVDRHRGAGVDFIT